MIISTSQPYFAPFPGFFYKMTLCDVIVLLDHVQFPRGTTWITRNRFKNDQGTLWMTIPVKKKGLGLQKINGVDVYHEGDWFRKHFLSLINAYGNAPYFKDHFSFLENLFSAEYEKLIDLNMNIIHHLKKNLSIGTKVVLSSHLDVASNGNQLLVDICRELGATRYVAQRPARKYLDPDLFNDAKIQLQFFKPPELVYPQLWGDFIPNLSTFDLIFNCGPKAVDILTCTNPEQDIFTI